MADAYKIGPNLADKIIDTIRRVGDMPYKDGRYAVPTRFEDAPQYNSLYRGTFTGSWETGQTVVVTLVQDTASTMAVTNYCVQIEADTASSASYNVIFGDAGGTMTALEIQQPTTTCTLVIGGLNLTDLPGYDEASIQLLGHPAKDTASTSCYSLQWYSVTQCGTAT